MIRDLVAAIIRDDKVPSNWEQSFIACLYKGKGDALDRGNYLGLIVFGFYDLSTLVGHFVSSPRERGKR